MDAWMVTHELWLALEQGHGDSERAADGGVRLQQLQVEVYPRHGRQVKKPKRLMTFEKGAGLNRVMNPSRASRQMMGTSQAITFVTVSCGHG